MCSIQLLRYSTSMMQKLSMALWNYDSFSRRNVSSSQQHEKWTANAYFIISQILNLTYYHFGLPRFVVKPKQTDLLRALWEAWVRDNTPSITAPRAVYSVILQAESALVVQHTTLHWLRLVRYYWHIYEYSCENPVMCDQCNDSRVVKHKNMVARPAGSVTKKSSSK